MFQQGLLGMGRRLAGVHRAAPGGRPRRNLLLLHTDTYQERADWLAVKEKIEARAPDIEVRVDSNDHPSADVYRWQIGRPSLVFSPFRLLAYRPPGGTVYAGREIGKVAEWRRMAESGLPIPQTARLAPDLVLPPESWGEYVIVKPVKGMRGQRIRLARTVEVGRRYAELSDGGRERMLVQKYVDHVDEQNRPFNYRVLTIFGEPLTASQRGWHVPRRPLAELADDPEGPIASNSRGFSTLGKLVKIPDVLALSRRVAAAFPEVPCLGQDIIRRTGTGDLYILETNPGGAIWHLSSQFAHQPGHDPAYAQAKYDQFGALDVVAEQLILRTRAEAS